MKSKYIGVEYVSSAEGPYLAFLEVELPGGNRKIVKCGYFRNEKDAAIARDQKILELGLDYKLQVLKPKNHSRRSLSEVQLKVLNYLNTAHVKFDEEKLKTDEEKYAFQALLKDDYVTKDVYWELTEIGKTVLDHFLRDNPKWKQGTHDQPNVDLLHTTSEEMRYQRVDLAKTVETMIECMSKMMDYTKGYSSESLLKDRKTYDAVMRNVSITAEAVNHLPHYFRIEQNEIEWQLILAAYDPKNDSAPEEELWFFITQLPNLKDALEELLAKL